MTMPFKPLEPGPDPIPGLFFLDASGIQPEKGLSAGIAFLISADGLLVTCAHVFVALNRVPGDWIELRSVSPEISVRVQAEVLADGWRGPSWEAWIERPDHRTRNWLAECDARPDVFRQDTALLRIVPGTARWDASRGNPVLGDPENHLRERVRVLPMAAPGYAHTARPRLKQWRVVYEANAPKVEPAYSEFQGLDPSLHDVLQIRSADLGHAYSGSPIWDEERERVVGMVRRWLRHAGSNALGVDARKLASIADIGLSLDPATLRFIELAANTIEAQAPLRHFPLLESFVPRELLRLRVRPADARDVLEDELPPSVVDALDALRAIVVEPAVSTTFVRGGAGAGKSMLLYQFAKELLSRPTRVDGRLAIPFPVTALELRKHDFDVSSVLATACRSFSEEFKGPAVNARCIAENDLCVVLLVDAVDEIEPLDRGRLFTHLKAFAAGHSRYRVVATTRPLEDRDTSLNPNEAHREVLELVPLEDAEIEQFAQNVFADVDARRGFRHALAEIEWDRTGPLPLQLAMAAKAFELQQDLGGRPVDLQFGLVQHLIELGKSDAARAEVGLPSDTETHARYVECFELILQRVAFAYLSGHTTFEEIRTEIEADTRFLADIKGVATPADLLLREARLRSALLHLEPRSGDGTGLRWPHRTVPEALAAKHLAWLKQQHHVTVGPEIDRLSRAHGQSLGVVILGALDQHAAGRLSVDRYLTACLDRGASQFKQTVFAMRALAASIKVGDLVQKRLIKTMIALLLLPPKVQLGRLLCAELFSIEDTPDMADLANRARIRPLVVEQLRERWSKRARRGELVVALTPREQKLLDRLGLWHEVGLQFAAPDRPGRGSDRLVGLAPVSQSPAPLPESGSAALLLAEIMARLRDRADGFMVGFANFVRQAPPNTDPVALAHAYFKFLQH